MAEPENLAQKKCVACEGGIRPFTQKEAEEYLVQVQDWEIKDGEINKTFTFKNFDQTMVFVNGVADIAREQNHHPEMEVSYKVCKIRYTTHAIHGLSENDFICAAKIDELLKK